MDQDGFGNPASSITACTQPVGYVQDNTDCNDANALIYVSAPCDDGSPVTFGDIYSNSCVCQGHGAQFTGRVLLSGPYESGSMRDDLRTTGLLPLTEPYTAMGYTFIDGGNETMAPFLMQVTGPFAPVDWVVIELSTPTAPANVVKSHAVLVTRDGYLMEGNGDVISFAVTQGSYHVGIRHRNHLKMVAQVAVPMGESPGTVDFTNPATQTFGLQAQKLVDGMMMMWPGDVNFDLVAKYTGASNDRDLILVRVGGTIPTNTVSGYYREDVNMDGIVKYTGANNDRDPILVTIGGTVPTAVRLAQLPPP